MNALLSGPVSLAELETKSGVDYETLRLLMNELRKGDVVHICGWRRDSLNRQSIALYQLGLGVDAKKQKPKTGAQRTQAWLNRNSTDELFKPMGETARIANQEIDNALRGWR